MNKKIGSPKTSILWNHIDIIMISVVVLIIGLVASPSFFSLSKRSKMAHPLNKIQDINWKQESYFLKNNTFARSLEELKIRIPSDLNNYRYSIQVADQAVFHYAISLQPDEMVFPGGYIGHIFFPSPNQYTFPSYLGMLWTVPNPTTDADEEETDIILHSVLCRSTYPHILEPGFQPIFEEDQFHCPEGMETRRIHSTSISSRQAEIPD